MATALAFSVVVPAYSKNQQPPAQLVPASSDIETAPYRTSAFVGAGFYSGQAERAGSQRGRASMQGHESFASPEDVVTAFIAALEAMDYVALDAMLGARNRDLLSSGNGEADTAARTQFLAAYRAKHALVAQGNGRKVLLVGESEWPLPIPIIAMDGKWYLDGAAGADEILYRSIGHNELGAIAVCLAFVEAQKAYAAVGHDGRNPGIFAARLLSDPGQQNGLHWRTAKDAPPSPAFTPVTAIPHVPAIPKKLFYDLAPKPTDKQKPFHGYYFRMLFAQGSNAQGGAEEYVVDGMLSGGIALLAWPAEYGTSGVMSFIVNHDGVVYQKDLGADTAAVAEAIQEFDPDSSWVIVESKY